MEPRFWHDRWSKGEIGFHKNEVHPFLLDHWDRLALEPNASVLVPLCGKSLDMLWLADRGHRVWGIEISALACAAFFAENSLAVTRAHAGRFVVWTSGKITILQGDVFDLTANDLASMDAIYDRAALIALPPEMRKAYASHLSRMLASPLPTLLITLEYDQSKRPGPPFSVSEDEVASLYGATHIIERLQAHDVLEPGSPWAQMGLTWLEEKAYRLNCKAL
jgi:thiopurine S-methyltransferase